MKPVTPPKNHVEGQWVAERDAGRWALRMRVGPFDCVLELQPNGSWFGRVWGWGGLLASGPADSRHQGMVECESVCANVATNVLDVLGSSAQVGRRAVGSDR